uniref:Matrin-type domain-containing protein n=1 Tax=Myripristis murdjan TaxID=586833 RepID=A0A667Z5F7_9TELE
MSHPLYNPYALENQRSSRGQYGLSGTQAGLDHLGESSRLDPGSVLGSSGVPSGTSISSGGRLSSVLPQSNYGPEQSRSMVPNMPLPQSSQRSQLFQTSNYAVSSDGSSSASNSRRGDMSSIPGLGDYPESDKPATVTEPSQPKYTSESAADILMQFGLSKEDLEHLISYPEDQLTPANLPFILRQIRIQKAKRSAAAETASAAVRQPSKVIDYGHTGKYTGGLGEEIGGKSRSTGASSGGSGSLVMMDTFSSTKRLAIGHEGQMKQQTHQQQQMPKQQTQMQSAVWPPVFSAMKTVPPAPHIPSVTDVSFGGETSVFHPGGTMMVRSPNQKIPPLMPATSRAGKRLPTPTMMTDYMAVTPRIFPHTCSLCNKECDQMKVSRELHSVVSPSRSLWSLYCNVTYFCVSSVIPFLESSDQRVFNSLDWVYDAGDAKASFPSPSSSHSDSHGSAKTTSMSKQSSNLTIAEESLRSSPTSKQSSKEKDSPKDPTKNSTPSLSSSYSNEGKSTQSLSKSTPSSSLVSSPSKLDKSKDLPEATSTTTPSTTTLPSSTSSSKASASSSLPSTDPPSSLQKKTPTAVAKCPVKTPSAGPANSGVRTRASSAATKMPASAVTEGVVAKSDHQVSAETTLAKSVKSETKMDTSSEMQSSPQGEELGVASQTQTGSFLLRSDAQSQGGLFSPLESGSSEETLKKDLKKTSEDNKEDGTENTNDEEEDESEGYQVLDSLDDQAGEEMDSSHLRDQDGSSEMQLTEPQDSPTLNDETYEVLDSVDDEGRTCQEDDNEMDINGSFQVLDSVIEDITTTDREDNQLIKDDKDIVLKPSVEEMSQTNKSDDKPSIQETVGKEEETSKAAHSQVLDSVSEQSPKDGKNGKKRNQKAEVDKCKTASIQSSQDTNKAAKDNVENQNAQIPNKELHSSDIDTVKTPECTIPEQKTSHILDSADDKTATEDHNQRHKTGQVLEMPSGQIVVKDIRQIEKDFRQIEAEMEEEEETYEVIDSVEDELVTTDQVETEKKEKTTKRGERTARKEDKPTNRSGYSTRLSKNDEKSPKKEVKKYNTRRKKIDTSTGTSEKEEEVQEVIKGSMLQVVDSVEEEPGQDAVNNTAGFSRRRSARRNKEDNATPNLTGALEKMDREQEEEEATYEILDSVEDETVNDDPPATERSDSRKRERTTKIDAKNEDIKTPQKEDTPTRKRHTPARDSAEGNREKTPKIEDKVTKKESTPTKTSDIVIRKVSEEEATYQILDSVEDETVNDDSIITQRSGGRGRTGRAKKTVQRTKKGSTPLKKNNNDAPEEAIGEEEEATYQVLDSLEDEAVDDPAPAKPSERGRRGRTKKEDKMTKNTDKQTQSSDSLAASTKNKEEEEEPVYQVVDAVEEDKVHVQDLATTEGSDRRRKERKKTEDKISEKKDTPTKTSNTTMGASEKIVVKDEALYEVVDSVEEDPTPEEESGRGRKERTPKKEAKKEDKLPQKSQSNLSPLESEKKDKSHKKGERTEEKQTTAMSLVNLDEVSEEEEDYPDDTAKEEELRKRQAAAKEKQLAIEREREERRTKEKEERERERRSSSSSSRSSSRRGRRRVKERGREKEEEEEEEKVGVDPKELVTLDEVGADEAEDEVGGAPRICLCTVLSHLWPFLSPGLEFVVPKRGFFCNLCSVFYFNESSAKESHCSSQRHYDNMKKELKLSECLEASGRLMEKSVPTC